jgi:hypothetical protein
MKHFTRANGVRRTRVLATIAGTIVVLCASICSDPQNGVIQSCRYSLSSNWPSGDRSFDPHNQASCPIFTPPGGRKQDYQAQAALPSGSTLGSGNLEFTDFHGNAVSQTMSVLYVCCDVYTFTGSYTAGTIPSADTTVNYDHAFNSIELSSTFGGGVATVNARLGYQTTVAAAVMGTGTIDPGQSSTLNGEFYESDLVPPVNFQWYRDESPISGATGASVQISGGDPNTSDTYKFLVTDAQNRSVSASLSVFTTAGCGTQFIC